MTGSSSQKPAHQSPFGLQPETGQGIHLEDDHPGDPSETADAIEALYEGGAQPEGSGEVESPAEPDAAEQLAAENADLKDRFVRLAADMENLRKRGERDVADARAFAISGFARDMLEVADNLRRAIEAVEQGGDNALDGLKQGVLVTESGMLSALERHGVRRIDPMGERFDPNFHQAMFEVPDAGRPNNTVMEVVQSGYKIGERVLRPALVGVSKGGPKV